ncbi:DUF3025 domain-containing protein|uniref:DUF3025 domain-containing protein n=1 Tax=Noviherbaspirillum sp. L7-7A TaxID=2850560 RepID=UPI001C2CBB49|nr:DUF3025 domain-containing protein [Noviherbaspirillum sp. L7-7A]MBV0880705.1 DUF3025 domain-containing protein [Noviherbaspirillum sp. L7-7A]
MPDDFLKQIDWRRPWLAPLQPVAELVLQAPAWRDGLNQQATIRHLRNHLSLPIQFVPQSALPEGVAYESFISATGCVPTRDNLHDFFNALVWLAFPRIKVRLNQLQAAEIARRALVVKQAQQGQQVRGRVRDAATIFDENAVLFLTSDPSFSSFLRAHHWKELFIESRQEFEEHCAVYLFGHALLEKLVDPYKAITGHAWILETSEDVLALPEPARREWLDQEVAGELKEGLSTSDFSHLPVLGVPGWWPAQDEAFYADSSVFRPAKKK